MEAMILAAGRGERLRPLTDRIPKPLIEVGGIPILERVARGLVAAGAHRLIINICHGAETIERFVTEHGGFGVEVVFSRESPEPLETGGGLLHAARHFDKEAPFFLHNGDILTDLDLVALYGAHTGSGPAPIATLAVAKRDTTRPLLVDDEGVYGRANRTEGWELIARHAGSGATEVGFSGVHVLSPDIFGRLTQSGTFSIVESYMRLISEGERVRTFDATEAAWIDVGTPERLERAQRLFGESEG